MDYLFTMGLARGHLTAGRYEEATRWVDSAISDSPQLAIALRIKIVLCELIGLDAEAKIWLQRLRTVAPDMTIATFRAYAARHYTPYLRTLYSIHYARRDCPTDCNEKRRRAGRAQRIPPIIADRLATAGYAPLTRPTADAKGNAHDPSPHRHPCDRLHP